MKIRRMTPAEGRQVLEDAAQQFLGITADEFMRRWDAGEYAEVADTRRVRRVAEMLPFGRPERGSDTKETRA